MQINQSFKRGIPGWLGESRQDACKQHISIKLQ